MNDVIQQQPFAVEVSNVYKSYGSKKNCVEALQGISVHISSGSIYSLLGPSGCGKTILLKCILGRLSIDSGHIMILGQEPDPKGDSLPSSLIGYMPQEMALHDFLTIEESLTYFGRLYKMSKISLQSRSSFLSKFLELPESSRLISTLSGGQKRRVSFSLALLHRPQLIILDEPTVGVDPLLRESIWNHLVQLTQDWNITIIVTTHYIEEARQSNMIGLIRNGHLLTEDSPEGLLMKHQQSSLENVFLQLCYAEENKNKTKGIIADSDEDLCIQIQHERITSSSLNDNDFVPLVRPNTGQRCKGLFRCSLPSVMNITALAIKNFKRLKRNILALLFIFFLPSFQITIFFITFGRDPHDLPIAIVNDDEGFLGSLFLKHLDSNTFTQKEFHNLESAKTEVKKGLAEGAVYIGRNFTVNLIERYEKSKVDDSVLNGSTIWFYLDMTDKQIVLTSEKKFLDSFLGFAKDVLNISGQNPRTAELPIKFGEPIYGEADSLLTYFLIPGLIISITHFIAVGFTAFSLLQDRKDGLIDRVMVAGVTWVELMIGHAALQFLIIAIQVTILLLITFLAFKVPHEGSLVWIIILTLLQGFCGMMYGIFISCICDEEISSVQIVLGTFYPSICLSGTIWPLESMPTALRYVCNYLPQTFATEALRNICLKGWPITHFTVWRGFVSTIVWMIIFFFSSTVVLKIRN